MARPTMLDDALSESIPRTRVTPLMLDKIASVSEELGITRADVIRGCIAYVLGFEDQNSELVARWFRRAAGG